MSMHPNALILYDLVLTFVFMNHKQLPFYEDEGFELEAGRSNGICHQLDEVTFLCNMFTAYDEIVFASTGVLKMVEEPDDGVVATVESVFNGEANGKISAVYAEDINTYTVCVQE